VDKKLSVLNFILIVALSGLLLWNVNIWINPKYPAQVDGSSLNTTPKSLQNYDLKRKTYPASMVSSVSSGNLFRKQRQEYIKAPDPVQVVSPASQKPKVPPPEFNVKGIMMLASSKIAVLDGKYYISSGQTEMSRKPIKKKGYRLGDYIGDYQVRNINKTSVTLSDDSGNSVTKKLHQKSTTPIEKSSSGLKYKPPKDNKKQLAKTNEKPRPVTPPRPVSRPQPKQSAPPQAAVPKPALVPHISGRPQYAKPRRGANISGANISGNRTRTNRPRISGR
jgi:hypothetical protein